MSNEPVCIHESATLIDVVDGEQVLRCDECLLVGNDTSGFQRDYERNSKHWRKLREELDEPASKGGES